MKRVNSCRVGIASLVTLGVAIISSPQEPKKPNILVMMVGKIMEQLQNSGGSN